MEGLIILLSVSNGWCKDFKMQMSQSKSKVISSIEDIGWLSLQQSGEKVFLYDKKIVKEKSLRLTCKLEKDSAPLDHGTVEPRNHTLNKFILFSFYYYYYSISIIMVG